MALDHLLAGLEREATGQVDALLTTARAEAARITAEADSRLARRRSVELDAEAARLRGIAEAALGAARQAGRARILEARGRLLERVFAAARASFPAVLASDAYQTALPNHLIEALGALGDEAATIRCPPELAGAVRAVLQRRKHVAVKSDPAAPPGITVTTADGVIAVDNTLAGRLEHLRPQLALDLLARLETP